MSYNDERHGRVWLWVLVPAFVIAITYGAWLVVAGIAGRDGLGAVPVIRKGLVAAAAVTIALVTGYVTARVLDRDRATDPLGQRFARLLLLLFSLAFLTGCWIAIRWLMSR
jgi:hypothetical protein